MTRDEQGKFRNRGRVSKGIYALPVVLVFTTFHSGSRTYKPTPGETGSQAFRLIIPTSEAKGE